VVAGDPAARLVGLKVQLLFDGSELHANETARGNVENPDGGVAVKLYEAVCPAETVCGPVLVLKVKSETYAEKAAARLPTSTEPRPVTKL